MTGRLRHFLLLALRLAWSRDISQRWRQCSVVFAAGLLALAIGFSVALVSAAAAAHQRDLDRRLVYAGTDPNPALQVSFRAEIWDGRQFPVLWLFGDADSPLPPGVAELPPPGTMVVSPAIANQPDVVAGLGLNIAPAGTGDVGVIGPEGLLAASEWLIYASPPKGRTLGEGGALVPVSGFGVTNPEAGMPVVTDPPAPTRNGTLYAIWPLLLVPAALLAWSGARARSDLRRNRSRTLHRLGFGPVALTSFTTLETLSLALPGAALAAILGSLTFPHIRGLPFTGLVLNDGALTLDPGWWVLILLVTLSAVTLMGGAGGSVTGDAVATQGRVTKEPSSIRAIPLIAGIAIMAVGRGFSDATGLALLAAGMIATVVSMPLALPLLVRIAGRLVSRGTSPAVWLAGNRMARSAHRHAGPAVVLGLLVFIVGGGTGVLVSNEARAAAQFAPTSNLGIMMLNWRDPHPNDVAMIADSLPDALVLPVADDTVFADSCDDVARLLARDSTDCDVSALSANLADLTGLPAQIGTPPDDVAISDVIIGGNAATTQATIWQAVNAHLPAVNLFSVAGIEWLRPPLMLSWIFGGLIVGATILALAAAHTFGNRLLALGQEDDQLLRIGLDGPQTRAVQRWTAIAPLLPALGVGFCGAVLFSWTGLAQEFTGLPLLLITVETASVALVASVAAAGVGLIQRRQGDRMST